MISTAQVSVGTAATLLSGSGLVGVYGHFSLLIRNTDAADSVFVGDEDVTTSNGFELPAGATMSTDLENLEGVYAVAASGTVRCDVLRTGVA